MGQHEQASDRSQSAGSPSQSAPPDVGRPRSPSEMSRQQANSPSDSRQPSPPEQRPASYSSNGRPIVSQRGDQPSTTSVAPVREVTRNEQNHTDAARVGGGLENRYPTGDGGTVITHLQAGFQAEGHRGQSPGSLSPYVNGGGEITHKVNDAFSVRGEVSGGGGPHGPHIEGQGRVQWTQGNNQAEVSGTVGADYRGVNGGVDAVVTRQLVEGLNARAGVGLNADPDGQQFNVRLGADISRDVHVDGVVNVGPGGQTEGALTVNINEPHTGETASARDRREQREQQAAAAEAARNHRSPTQQETEAVLRGVEQHMHLPPRHVPLFPPVESPHHTGKPEEPSSGH